MCFVQFGFFFYPQFFACLNFELQLVRCGLIMETSGRCAYFSSPLVDLQTVYALINKLVLVRILKLSFFFFTAEMQLLISVFKSFQPIKFSLYPFFFPSET